MGGNSLQTIDLHKYIPVDGDPMYRPPAVPLNDPSRQWPRWMFRVGEQVIARDAQEEETLRNAGWLRERTRSIVVVDAPTPAATIRRSRRTLEERQAALKKKND